MHEAGDAAGDLASTERESLGERISLQYVLMQLSRHARQAQATAEICCGRLQIEAVGASGSYLWIPFCAETRQKAPFLQQL